MKASITFLCGVVLLCGNVCLSQEIDTIPNDSEEAVKLEALLAASRTSTTQKPSSTSTTTPKPTLGNHKHHAEDPDYSFQNERLPLLSDDEFNGLTDDANPLYFLKQLPEEPTKPQEIKSDSYSGAPIYITIPIYINTSGKMPLSLTIGDQEMPLHQQRRSSSHKKSHSTKAPNSHFNRLLQQIEPPKRRTTNRHRSQSRSKIQALKEQNAAELYKKLGFQQTEQ